MRAFHAEATRVVASQPDWLSVILALPSSRQLVNTLVPFGATLPETVERRSFDEAVQTARASVGYLSRGPISGTHAFPIRVPVVRNGALKYVLSAVVRPRAIRDLLGAQRLPSDWVGVVLDGDARIVARSFNPEVSVGELASQSLRAELARSPEGWFHGRALEGQEVYTAYHRSASSKHSKPWLMSLTGRADSSCARALSTTTACKST